MVVMAAAGSMVMMLPDPEEMPVQTVVLIRMKRMIQTVVIRW